MHFVFSAFGSSGDVFPLVGLALELKHRGHEVTFAVNEHFAELVRRQELAFEPLGTQAQFDASIANPDLWHAQRSFRHIVQSLIQPALRQQYDILERHGRAGPTTGVTNCFGFGALMAQDKLNVPVVTVHCQPAVIWSDIAPPEIAGLRGPNWLRSLFYGIGERFFIDPVVCPFINAWRDELGLAPVRQVTSWWHSRYAVVCLFPQWYCPVQIDWPPGVIQSDFPLWDDAAAAQLPADVEDFLAQGSAPLVFTPGSTNVFGEQFFGAAIEACRRLGRRGILLTHYAQQVPRPLPQDIAYFSFVPFSELLPRCAAVVHHGGVGSVSQALAAGIPQVIMPLAHDQFDNAQRVTQLGCGSRLLPRRFTGERLARQLNQLMTSAAVKQQCRAIAKRMANRRGLASAASGIEERISQTRKSPRGTARAE